MEIIKNGDINHLKKYTTFTCPVCQCQFKVNLDNRYEENEYDLAFDHISSNCPECQTPVRNYFTDPEVAPVVRVYYYKKLEHQQEANRAEIKKKFNESFKSAMNDVIMARDQFERNHKARMAELQEQLDKMSQSDSFDTDQIDQKIDKTQKVLKDLLK